MLNIYKSDLMKVVLSSILLCSLSACERKQPGKQSKSSNIMFAPKGEMTLEEKIGVPIPLPVPAAKLFVKLKMRSLQYAICGRRNTTAGLPPARHDTNFDLSDAQTCYEIYGDRDEKSGVMESWRAFANRADEIIYVESAYAYPAR